MKLLNKNTDYAVRSLGYIAKGKNRIVTVSELAEKLKISMPFLRKILQILNKKGLLKSYKGRNGGFILAHSADKIFLLDLIKIFQGPVQLADCLFKKEICPDMSNCVLKKKIYNIEKYVKKELESITLKSLLQ